MSRSQRRAMIDREEPKLSLVRQCALLGISRSSLYYLPTEAGAEDMELMALIDQQYLKTPFYGSRRVSPVLSNCSTLIPNHTTVPRRLTYLP